MEYKTLDLIKARPKLSSFSFWIVVAGGWHTYQTRPDQTDRHPFIIQTVSRKLSDYVGCLCRTERSYTTQYTEHTHMGTSSANSIDSCMKKVNENDVKV